MSADFLPNLINAAVFSFMGIVIYALGFMGMNLLSPSTLWREIIEEHNVSLAILLGSISVGISIIIAASVHGG